MGDNMIERQEFFLPNPFLEVFLFKPKYILFNLYLQAETPYLTYL
jgi:hypothetical protein